MVGRGAVQDPLLFHRIRHSFVAGQELGAGLELGARGAGGGGGGAAGGGGGGGGVAGWREPELMQSFLRYYAAQFIPELRPQEQQQGPGEATSAAAAAAVAAAAAAVEQPVSVEYRASKFGRLKKVSWELVGTPRVTAPRNQVCRCCWWWRRLCVLCPCMCPCCIHGQSLEPGPHSPSQHSPVLTCSLSPCRRPCVCWLHLPPPPGANPFIMHWPRPPPRSFALGSVCYWSGSYTTHTHTQWFPCALTHIHTHIHTHTHTHTPQVMKYLFASSPQLAVACESLLRVRPDSCTPADMVDMLCEQVRGELGVGLRSGGARRRGGEQGGDGTTGGAKDGWGVAGVRAGVAQPLLQARVRNQCEPSLAPAPARCHAAPPPDPLPSCPSPPHTHTHTHRSVATGPPPAPPGWCCTTI